MIGGDGYDVTINDIDVTDDVNYKIAVIGSVTKHSTDEHGYTSYGFMYVLDTTLCQVFVKVDFPDKSTGAVKIFATGTYTFTTIFSLYDSNDDTKEYLFRVESDSNDVSSELNTFTSTIPSASYTVVGGVQRISTNERLLTIAEDRLNLYDIESLIFRQLDLTALGAVSSACYA